MPGECSLAEINPAPPLKTLHCAAQIPMCLGSCKCRSRPCRLEGKLRAPRDQEEIDWASQQNSLLVAMWSKLAPCCTCFHQPEAEMWAGRLQPCESSSCPQGWISSPGHGTFANGSVSVVGIRAILHGSQN